MIQRRKAGFIYYLIAGLTFLLIVMTSKRINIIEIITIPPTITISTDYLSLLHISSMMWIIICGMSVAVATRDKNFHVIKTPILLWLLALCFTLMLILTNGEVNSIVLKLTTSFILNNTIAYFFCIGSYLYSYRDEENKSL